jgi:hypothetical protein
MKKLDRVRYFNAELRNIYGSGRKGIYGIREDHRCKTLKHIRIPKISGEVKITTSQDGLSLLFQSKTPFRHFSRTFSCKISRKSIYNEGINLAKNLFRPYKPNIKNRGHFFIRSRIFARHRTYIVIVRKDSLYY